MPNIVLHTIVAVAIGHTTVHILQIRTTDHLLHLSWSEHHSGSVTFTRIATTSPTKYRSSILDATNNSSSKRILGIYQICVVCLRYNFLLSTLIVFAQQRKIHLILYFCVYDTLVGQSQLAGHLKSNATI